MAKRDLWYSLPYLRSFSNETQELDYASVRSGLEKMSQQLHCRYYDDELNDLLNMAAYLENDIDGAIASFESFPCRNKRSEDEPGIYWFNAVMTLYNGIDLDCLQMNEEDDTANPFVFQTRKLNAVFSLDKSTMLTLISTVLSLVFRYFAIKTTIEAVLGIDEEMQHRQSLFKKNGKVILSGSEYL